MILDLVRFSDNGESTLGLLFVDKKFFCYTLEDEHRAQKVRGETRIPAGEYKVAFRTVGDMNERYAKEFKRIHKGMLEVLDVPGYSGILIHVGNTDRDTAGCILVGDNGNNNSIGQGKITESKTAYIRLYLAVSQVLVKSKSVELHIHDESTIWGQ